MNLEVLRTICKKLPAVTEDIKWEHDLCFMVASKMFCVTGLDGPFSVSLKVADEEFDEMTARTGIIPAPYLARHKWILVEDPNALTKKEWNHFITQSYQLVKNKLSKSILKKHGIE